jgi:hypothetical protein
LVGILLGLFIRFISALPAGTKQTEPVVRAIPQHKRPVHGFSEHQSQAEANVSERRDTSMSSSPDIVPQLAGEIAIDLKTGDCGKSA